MKDRQYKAKAKRVQKMTRRGLIERNEATGEEQRVSQREQDVSFAPEREAEAVGTRAEETGRYYQRRPPCATPFERPLRQRVPKELSPCRTSPAPLRNGAGDAEQASRTVPTDVGPDPPPLQTHHDTTAYPRDGPEDEPERPAATETHPGDLGPVRKDKGKFSAQATTALRERSVAHSQPTTPAPKRRKLFYSRWEIPAANRVNRSPSPFVPKEQRKLEQAKRREGVAVHKWMEARGKLPTRLHPHVVKEYNPSTGGVRRKLRFERETADPQSPGSILAGTALSPLKEKVREEVAASDNVGLEAAQEGAGLAGRVLHFARDRPYRKAAKWERRARRATLHRQYSAARVQDPKHGFARALQKRRIRKQYQEAARAAKQGGKTVKGAATLGAKLVRAAVQLVAENKVVLGITAAIILFILILLSCMSSCAAMLTGGAMSAVVPSYKAEDPDIHDSDLLWTELEMDLQEQIDQVEVDYPEYDEYRYDLDEIGHDPFELISYLSAMYGDFTFAGIEGAIRRLFEDVYDLQMKEEIEIRYREVITRNPETGEETTELVPYEWKILNIILRRYDFDSVVRPPLEERESDDLYDAFIDTGGGHQMYGNPLGYYWPDSVTSTYGYRENPTGPGWDLHRGIDIAAPYGSPVYAVQDGTVIDAGYHRLYGNYMTIEDDEGRRSKYAHCSAILAEVGADVKKGDEIAQVGSTGNSTGSHLHVEIQENGIYCNPLFLLEFTVKEDEK